MPNIFQNVARGIIAMAFIQIVLVALWQFIFKRPLFLNFWSTLIFSVILVSLLIGLFSLNPFAQTPIGSAFVIFGCIVLVLFTFHVVNVAIKPTFSVIGDISKPPSAFGNWTQFLWSSLLNGFLGYAMAIGTAFSMRRVGINFL